MFTFGYHLLSLLAGGYDKEEKAARAYDLAALKYRGTTTTTNFPVSCHFFFPVSLRLQISNIIAYTTINNLAADLFNSCDFSPQCIQLQVFQRNILRAKVPVQVCGAVLWG